MTENSTIKPEQVCAALNALYHNQNPALKKQANDFLYVFQAKPEAWQVADRILQTTNLPQETYYFAANALRLKLLNSFQELPNSKSRLSFRDSLLNHLLTFQKGPAIVRSCLGLCLANLAIHLVTQEWKDVFPTLINTLAKPETAVILLDILTGIPEECTNKRLHISRDHRQIAFGACKEVSTYILKVLASYFQSAGNNRDLQRRVLKCFLSWIQQGFMFSEEAQKLLLSPAGHMLLDAPFLNLGISDLFSVSADIIAELLRQCEDVTKCALLLNYLFPRVLALEPLYDQAAGDETTCQKLSVIFIELGECYLPWIIDLSPQARQTLSIILKIGRSATKDVAIGTFNFWYVLVTRLTGRRSDDGVDDVDEEHASSQRRFRPPINEEKIKMFIPFYVELLDIIIRIMEFPPDVDTWDESEKDKYKKYRYFAAEALVDASYILGTSCCLAKIISSLEKEYTHYCNDQEKKWQKLEANLYCIRSIARRVNTNENFVLPKVLPLITNLADNSSLRYTCTLIIGRYSDWINIHEGYLQGSLKYIVQGLNDPKVVASATLAFKYVCEGCVRHLANQEYFPRLLAVYNNSYSLQFSDQKQIIEGVSRVASVLPKAQIMDGLWLGIISPVINLMNATLSSGPNSTANSQQSNKQISLCLDILAHIFRSLDTEIGDAHLVSVCLVESLKRLWQHFSAILDKFKTCNRIMEKLCRVWKYGLKTARLEFAPLLQPLLSVITNSFNQYPHSCFIYCVCSCVDIFYKSEFQEVLQNVFGVISQRVLQILKNGDSFQEKPDIVEDYFELASRFTRRCPQLIFNNPILIQVFACGTHGLGLQHKEALSALMQFFGTLLNCGCDGRDGPAPAPYKSVISTLLQQSGDALASGLINGIADVLPSVRLKVTFPVLQAFIHFDRERAKARLASALGKLPETRKPSKMEFLQLLINARSRGDFREAIYSFRQVCRHTNK